MSSNILGNSVSLWSRSKPEPDDSGNDVGIRWHINGNTGDKDGFVEFDSTGQQ